MSNPATPDPATSGFVFNHTMLRVKNAEASLDFYTRVLGFSVIAESHFAEAKFSLYFLILDPEEAGRAPDDPQERRAWRARLKGVLELTHNHGTEAEPGPVYHDGNSEPRGFGHICLSVPDARAACERFDQLGVSYQKRLGQGGMKDIAFIKDPDGYWIEIIQPTSMD
jgi:lactoylglutathione lyase